MTKGKTGRRPTLNPDRTPATSVHVNMSASLYDQTYAAAREARLTVQDWIRDTLRKATAAPSKGADQ